MKKVLKFIIFIAIFPVWLPGMILWVLLLISQEWGGRVTLVQAIRNVFSVPKSINTDNKT